MRRFTLITLFLLCTSHSWGEETSEIVFKDAHLTLYRFEPGKTKLELFWKDENGQPYNTFKKLEAAQNAKGQQLKFATNAGIYLPGFLPEGLHIEKGRTLRKLNLKPAPDVSPKPNFSLKPNGVFFIRHDDTAAVLESFAFGASGETPRLAVQSGPLLVDKGVIHPAFNEPSPNKLLRNGVGVDSQGRIVFACSSRDPDGRGTINLYGFAELFRDKLDCESALYLDGDISEIFVRGKTGPLQNTTAFAAILAILEGRPATTTP